MNEKNIPMVKIIQMRSIQRKRNIRTEKSMRIKILPIKCLRMKKSKRGKSI